jgi:hypothetical protein
MAYVVNGNLYVEDSGAQPIQATNSGEDYAPQFSSDGQVIVFYRGKQNENYQVFAINANGSGERAVINGKALAAFGFGNDEFVQVSQLTFVTGTHDLLFNAFKLKNGDPGQTDVNGNVPVEGTGLFLVDTDSGKVRRILAAGQAGMFELSPDRKSIAVQGMGTVDVFNINGQSLRHNLITYPYPEGYEGSYWTFVLSLYWNREASQLITLLPINPADYPPDDGPDQLNVWKYPLDGQLPVEIQLNPPPMGNSNDFNISPDGNWIVYHYYYYPGKSDETVTEGIYLGNLRDGSTRFLGSSEQYGLPHYFWSQDSEHFILEDYQLGMFMGDVNGKVTPLTGRGCIGWLDESRYLYGNAYVGEIGLDTKVKVGQSPTGQNNQNPDYFSYVYLKK